ncbi:MAG: glycosyltransferase family 2 protein [Desulfobacteraceae bacterium]|nr:MAG: glycosyltransferase family 2 protein [Desulfobacteraceae bacterium]
MDSYIMTRSEMGTPNQPAYVLITPVKDEEALIGETIASVISQSILPLQWVIVCDGCTDRTEEIVRAATECCSWIRLICLPQRAERSFAAVVHAAEAGALAITVKDYHYIGLLDADLRFGPDYFERVIERFETNPRLGLGGGMVVDLGQPKDRSPRNRLNVPGAAQFFRRKCFEDLGGLIAIPEGGWDTLTCIQARMLGYETRLFTDLVIDHLKPRNISKGGMLRRMWQMGVRDYALGYHPVFEVFKCTGRLAKYPPVVGAVAWLAGYLAANLMRRKRLIPHNMLRFSEAEQLGRVKRACGLSRSVACQFVDGAHMHANSGQPTTGA